MVGWAPDYLTLAQAKGHLRLSDTIDDAEIGVLITAASRAIDTACNRQFGNLSVAAARTYRRPASYDALSGLWRLPIDDVQDLTGLTIGGVAYAATGAVLQPDNAPADNRPWTSLGFTDRPGTTYPGAPSAVVVVAKWGWSAVPAQVAMACRLQVSRWAARRESPLGVAGSPDSGSEVRLLAKLDPDVATSLAGLRRRRRVG